MNYTVEVEGAYVDAFNSLLFSFRHIYSRCKVPMSLARKS